jgi:hypothetical protein
MTVIFYEVGNLRRQIYTDGRALPKEFDKPVYLGYSVGRWERDVLVVETAGFNDKTPLDMMGHPHSEALRVTERYRRRDFGHLDYEMTIDDPQTYKRPFTIKVSPQLTRRVRHLRELLRGKRERRRASSDTPRFWALAGLLAVPGSPAPKPSGSLERLTLPSIENTLPNF